MKRDEYQYIQPHHLQFRQLAQFSRDGTWGIQVYKLSQNIQQKQVTLSDIPYEVGWSIWKASLLLHIEHEVIQNKSWI